MKRYIFLFLFLVLYCSCQAKVLIWDLGDVLFKQSHFGIARTIGLGHFLSYTLGDWKSPHIQPLLFDVLSSFGVQQADEHQKVRDHHGNELPQIMCDWLIGKIAPHDLIEKVHERIEELDDSSFFISMREKQLIKESVSIIFDPEHFAYHNKPVREAIKLLKECARFRDEQGMPHTLMVLSNWDPYSFDILYNTYYEILDLFDHIVISGDIGLAKPHGKCFEHVIETYKLVPEDCYFIDDQLNNVRASQDCCINGLLLKDGNYRELKRKMKEFGLL